MPSFNRLLSTCCLLAFLWAIVLFSMPTYARAEVNFYGCSQSEIHALGSLKKDAAAKIDELGGQVNDRLWSWGGKDLDSIPKLLHAKKTLSCAGDALETLNIECHNQHDRCTSGYALAWINWMFDTTIHLCDSFWDYDTRASVLIHESTHKCGTTDAAYFGKGDEPHTAGLIGWDKIASTYEYWADYGFCVPGHDC